MVWLSTPYLRDGRLGGVEVYPLPAFFGAACWRGAKLPWVMPRPVCRFDYLYRDAGNYKGYGSVLLRGDATPENEAAIRAALIDGMYFEAERVGVPALYHLVRGDAEPDEAEDHGWHEFVRLLREQAPKSAPVMGLGDLIQRMEAVNGAP